MRLIDLTGKRFGRLVVLKKDGTIKHGYVQWLCQCDCGNMVVVGGNRLRRNDTKSCGCYKTWIHRSKTKIKIGSVFGKLKVLKKYGYINGQSRWVCQCECGTIRIIRGRYLTSGSVKSCGCSKVEASLKRIIDLSGKKFGRWNVLEKSTVSKNNRIYWRCRCDCGVYRDVEGHLLRSGQSKSCGCYHADVCRSIRGSKHPNWQGGISTNLYCTIWSDDEYKDSIKERDGYCCQNPKCWKKTLKTIVHHINYDKKDCRPVNLITLCYSCNARANFNRSYWQHLYEDMMRERDLLNDRSSSHN